MTVQATADKATTNADSQTVTTSTTEPASAEPAPAATLDTSDAAIPVDAPATEPVADTTTEPTAADTATEEPEAAESETSEPVEYEFTIPDGFEPHEEAISDFKSMAAEMKLPQDQAQKLLDKYHELRQADFDSQRNKLNDEMVRIWQDQQKEIKNDPEFGGPKFGATQEMVAYALHKFGGPRGKSGEFPLASALKDAGMANNPELFRFFARVGQYCREASAVVSDSRSAAAPKTTEEALFPDYNP